jgi:hypothetical protein
MLVSCEYRVVCDFERISALYAARQRTTDSAATYPNAPPSTVSLSRDKIKFQAFASEEAQEGREGGHDAQKNKRELFSETEKILCRGKRSEEGNKYAVMLVDKRTNKARIVEAELMAMHQTIKGLRIDVRSALVRPSPRRAGTRYSSRIILRVISRYFVR